MKIAMHYTDARSLQPDSEPRPMSVLANLIAIDIGMAKVLADNRPICPLATCGAISALTA
jgi:hypothetical protein